MRLKIVSYTTIERALVEGLAPTTVPFEYFLPPGRRGSTRDDSDPGDIGNRRPLGFLRTHAHARRYFGPDCDRIGFERAGEPLFLDPFLSSLDRRPWLKSLRDAYSDAWNSEVLPTDGSTIDAYRRERAAMSDGDRARLYRWLAATDVVTTPILPEKLGPVRRVGIRDSLTAVRALAGDLDVFGANRHEAIEPMISWPTSLSYIMASEAHTLFSDGLFRLLEALDKAHPALVEGHAVALGEFAFGLFLRDWRLRDPLLRIQQIPTLQERRDVPSAAILQAFDPDFYQATYPDIVAAQADPFDHFKCHGYREYRDWTAPCD
jgi:hypothetical protein